MSDFKALAKHSANYLAAIVASKALVFISIPIYTRLMTVHDYGVMEIFISTIGIIHVLLTLNTEVAVSRYYYEAKDEGDFKDFVTTTVKLTSMVWAMMTLITLAFSPILAQALSFPLLLTIALIPVATYQSINSIFTQIYQPLLQSRKIAIVTSVQAYLAFGLSVLFIILLKENKYYGYALGTITAMVVLAVYLVRQIRPYVGKGKIQNEHVKYILNFCLPYIPYTLSGILLAQFGKIVMSKYGGFEMAGIYSFTSNIGMMMMVLISVTNSAWNPYYLQYMTNKDYRSIDKDYNLIWRVTLVGGVALSLFGKEIGMMLGRPQYHAYLYVLPLLVLGYIFYQWSYVYLRSTAFAKKNIWNAVAIIISGVSNILLNIFLITRYGVIGIATSFMVSYLILLIGSYIINRYVLKQYVPKGARFLTPLLCTLPFLGMASVLIWRTEGLDWMLMAIKAVVLFFFGGVIIWRYYSQLKLKLQHRK